MIAERCHRAPRRNYLSRSYLEPFDRFNRPDPKEDFADQVRFRREVAYKVKHDSASTRLGKDDGERCDVDPSLMRLTEE